MRGKPRTCVEADNKSIAGMARSYDDGGVGLTHGGLQATVD